MTRLHTLKEFETYSADVLHTRLLIRDSRGRWIRSEVRIPMDVHRSRFRVFLLFSLGTTMHVDGTWVVQGYCGYNRLGPRNEIHGLDVR